MSTVTHLSVPTHDSEQVLDIVIPVRTGEVNEQLRYALRSFAAHLPHDRVWIVGFRPRWLRNVHHLPTRQDGSRYRNTTEAVRAACLHEGVSDPFLLANDDFFAMEPVRVLHPYHRGTMAELERYYVRKYARTGLYLQGLRDTRKLLARLGYADPLSYDVHVPLLVGKEQMLRALNLAAHLPVVHKRSLYGNLCQLGGRRITDPKVLTLGPNFVRGSWLSTTADSFARGKVGQHIRRILPAECRYEQPGSSTTPAARPAAAGVSRPTRRVARQRRVTAPAARGR